MMKKILTSLTIFILFASAGPVHADQITDCDTAVGTALRGTMGHADSTAPSGYFKQLSDLLSTNTPVYLLIDEVQQLARDARIELMGICQQVGRFNSMDSNYVAAYDLQQCKVIQANSGDTNQLQSTLKCETASVTLLDEFLDDLRGYMLRQAVRTSIEPLVQKMRSLNSRLTVLLKEYGRVVGNFYTFDFRLGDTIIGERD